MGKLVTLAQLRSDVRDRYDIDAASTRLSNSSLDRLINAARDELYAGVLGLDEGYTETRTALLTTVSVPFLSLPVRFAALIAVHVTLEGQEVQLRASTVDELGRTATAYPWSERAPTFRLQGGALYFTPAPAGAYTVTITHLEAPADLVADTDAWDAHPLMVEWVTLGVIAKLYQRDRAWTEASQMAALQNGAGVRLLDALHAQDRTGPVLSRRLADSSRYLVELE